MLFNTDEVSIPVEAIEYIDKRLKTTDYSFIYIFEVIELFFEWLSKQDDNTKKTVLRKALLSAYVLSLYEKFSGKITP